MPYPPLMAETGRGNYNREQIARLRECLMAHPEGVSGATLADHIGVSRARAMGLLDVADRHGFLTCLDGEGTASRYFACAVFPELPEALLRGLSVERLAAKLGSS